MARRFTGALTVPRPRGLRYEEARGVDAVLATGAGLESPGVAAGTP
ncbi:hypothetical protein [Streptosporangium sp. OZ121]